MDRQQAGRGLQGIGAAMLLTAGLALVTRLSPPEQRGRAIGSFLGLVAAVPALGPFVSGALVDLLFRLSRLGQDLPAVSELDLNPVLARPDGCLALDARVRVTRPDTRTPTKTW